MFFTEAVYACICMYTYFNIAGTIYWFDTIAYIVFVRVCFSLVYTFKIEWLHARLKRSRDIVYIVSVCRTEINALFKICIGAKTEYDAPDDVIHSLLLLAMTCAKFERNPRLSHMAIKPVHSTTAFNNN